MIVVENLYFTYGSQGDYVLKDINLEIGEGELLAIMGDNGAGKTTLIRILSTLLLPTSGEAYVD